MNTVLTSEFRDRYNAFVDSSPQGTLYCHTWWLDAVAPGRYDLLTVRKGDVIQAAWPIVWASERQRSRTVMPQLTQKLGILFAPSHAKYAERLSKEHRLEDELISQLPPHTYVDANFHEDFTNWLPFYWHGCQQTTLYTYVLEDLGNLDAIWAAMRGHLRTEIRKAERRGLSCRQTDDLWQFYEFNAKIFARKGRNILYSYDFLRRIDEACLEHAGRRIVVAEDSEGRVHACRYLVYDQNRALLVAGGADAGLRGSGANCLLDWELIKFAATVSRQFDFTGSVTVGIEPYLRKFGATRKPYFRIWGNTDRPPRPPHSWLRRYTGGILRELAHWVDG